MKCGNQPVKEECHSRGSSRLREGATRDYKGQHCYESESSSITTCNKTRRKSWPCKSQVSQVTPPRRVNNTPWPMHLLSHPVVDIAPDFRVEAHTWHSVILGDVRGRRQPFGGRHTLATPTHNHVHQQQRYQRVHEYCVNTRKLRSLFDSLLHIAVVGSVNEQ